MHKFSEMPEQSCVKSTLEGLVGKQHLAQVSEKRVQLGAAFESRSREGPK